MNEEADLVTIKKEKSARLQKSMNELEQLDAATLNQYLDIAVSGESLAKAMERMQKETGELGELLKGIKARHAKFKNDKSTKVEPPTGFQGNPEDLPLDAVLLNQYLDIASSEKGLSKAMEKIRQRMEDLGVQLKDAKERRLQLARKKSDKNDNITVLSGGSGRGREAVFVECTQTSVKLLPSGKRLSVGEVKPGNNPLQFLLPSKKTSFESYLSEHKKTPGKTLVFLIRPGATSMFRKALASTENLGLSAGYLPLPSDAPVKIASE
jgi:hypothetical protein